MEGEKKFNDNDPSAYKTHILYVIFNDPNCDSILNTIDKSPLYDEIYVQDVHKIKRRPEWLDVVPILVNKENNKFYAYKGKNILTYIQSWKSNDFLPATASIGGFSSFESGDAFGSGFSNVNDTGMFNLEEDENTRKELNAPMRNNDYETAPPQSGGGGGGERGRRKRESEAELQQRVEQLMNSRNSLDMQIKGEMPRNTSALSVFPLNNNNIFNPGQQVQNQPLHPHPYHQQQQQQPILRRPLQQQVQNQPHPPHQPGHPQSTYYDYDHQPPPQQYYQHVPYQLPSSSSPSPPSSYYYQQSTPPPPPPTQYYSSSHQPQQYYYPSPPPPPPPSSHDYDYYYYQHSPHSQYN